MQLIKNILIAILAIHFIIYFIVFLSVANGSDGSDMMSQFVKKEINLILK